MSFRWMSLTVGEFFLPTSFVLRLNFPQTALAEIPAVLVEQGFPHDSFSSAKIAFLKKTSDG
jgi:hypothetical protein